jgi:hypothetical protein
MLVEQLKEEVGVACDGGGEEYQLKGIRQSLKEWHDVRSNGVPDGNAV